MSKFCKYEAAGNDFIIVDKRNIPCTDIDQVLAAYQACAKHWCDRHFGIGADGILVMTMPPANAPECQIAMYIVNADGSMAAMCGNGIRCAGRWWYEKACDHNWEKNVKIYTLGGIQTVRCLSKDNRHWQLEVEMARAELTKTCKISQGEEIWQGQCVDVGNPHAVFEVTGNPNEALEKAGSYLSHHSTFPDRSNIEFIREISPKTLEMAVYERGVGPTLACGTGCVASAVAYAHSRGIAEGGIVLHLPGGCIQVVLRAHQPPLLQGPACHVFDGVMNAE